MRLEAEVEKGLMIKSHSTAKLAPLVLYNDYSCIQLSNLKSRFYLIFRPSSRLGHRGIQISFWAITLLMVEQVILICLLLVVLVLLTYFLWDKYHLVHRHWLRDTKLTVWPAPIPQSLFFIQWVYKYTFHHSILKREHLHVLANRRGNLSEFHLIWYNRIYILKFLNQDHPCLVFYERDSGTDNKEKLKILCC